MRLLRLRDFRIVVFAYGLSALGDYLALIALTLRVHDLTGSGWAVSGLLLSGMVPLVLAAPVAGYLVDRFETVRVLWLAAAAQTAVALGLVVAGTLPVIFTLFFVLNAGFAVAQPAVFALTPAAVGEENTTEANAYLEVARWSGATAGPFLAGAITATLGSDSAIFANAMTFLAVAVAVPFLRVRRPGEREDEEGASGFRRARRGVTFIARDRVLRLVVVAIAAMVVFAAIDNVAEVFFAKGVLRGGDVGYGALVTAWTAGMVVGATVIGRRLEAAALAPSVLGAAVVGGGALLVTVAWPSMPLALAAFVVGGVANGVELVGMRSLIHKRVPDRLRGRVFSAYYAVVNVGQIGAMGLGGALVTGIGARGSLAIGGMGTLAAGLVGLGLLARLARREAALDYSTIAS